MASSEPTREARAAHLPDGSVYYGQLGEVAYDPVEDKVQCHICGRWMRRVGGGHLSLKHPGWSMARYREVFALKSTQTLIADGTRARLRENAVGRLEQGKLGSPLGGGSGLQAEDWRSLAERRPDVAAELHPARNGDLDAASLGIWSMTRVWWACSRCGHEWQAPVAARASGGTGCPRCARASQGRSRLGRKQNRAPLSMRRPDLAAELHPTRNPGLDAGAVGPWAKRKVWWLCSVCSNEWEALVMERHQGAGCPRCARQRRVATYQSRQAVRE